MVDVYFSLICLYIVIPYMIFLPNKKARQLVDGPLKFLELNSIVTAR